MLPTTSYQVGQDRRDGMQIASMHDRISTTIYATRNYAQFSFDETNRPINPDKLARLYDAVQAKNLLADNPILVSLTYIIIDGQHRLKVAEGLGVPVYYQFASDASIEDVAMMSSNRSPWKFADYLSSWCARGNPEYLRLREFVKRFDWMIPSIAMELCYYGGRENLRVMFAEGRYICNDVVYAEKVARALLDFRAMGFKHWRSRVFTYAVSQLLANSDYNHKQMMDRLEGNREALYPAVNTDDYFKMFNRIYNHKARSGRVELQKLNVNDPRYRADKKAEKAAART